MGEMAIYVVAPTAQRTDLFLALDGIGLADESFDVVAGFEPDRPNTKRRWNRRDKGSEMFGTQLPHFDFDPGSAPRCDPDQSRFRRLQIGERVEAIVWSGTRRRDQPGVPFDQLEMQRLAGEMGTDDGELYALARFDRGWRRGHPLRGQRGQCSIVPGRRDQGDAEWQAVCAKTSGYGNGGQIE